jgi:hypothetical protein
LIRRAQNEGHLPPDMAFTPTGVSPAAETTAPTRTVGPDARPRRKV